MKITHIPKNEKRNIRAMRMFCLELFVGKAIVNRTMLYAVKIRKEKQHRMALAWHNWENVSLVDRTLCVVLYKRSG